MAETDLNKILSKYVPKWYAKGIRVDPSAANPEVPVEPLAPLSGYFEWNVGGTTVYAEKVVLVPVFLKDSSGTETSDWIAIGYLGAGGSG